MVPSVRTLLLELGLPTKLGDLVSVSTRHACRVQRRRWRKRYATEGGRKEDAGRMREKEKGVGREETGTQMGGGAE
jgi:hypothetical protein